MRLISLLSLYLGAIIIFTLLSPSIMTGQSDSYLSEHESCGCDSDISDVPAVSADTNLRDYIVEKIIENGSVKVDLFVMSHCPFGVKAEVAIIPILKEFGELIDFNLFYIAEEKPGGGFNSLHGQPEVEEDIRQLVIAKYYPDKLLDYLLARADNYQSNAWEKPSNDLEINPELVKAIVNSTKGKTLFLGNIQKGNELRIGSSPTIMIDDEKYKGRIFSTSHASSDLYLAYSPNTSVTLNSTGCCILRYGTPSTWCVQGITFDSCANRSDYCGWNANGCNILECSTITGCCETSNGCGYANYHDCYCWLLGGFSQSAVCAYDGNCHACDTDDDCTGGYCCSDFTCNSCCTDEHCSGNNKCCYDGVFKRNCKDVSSDINHCGSCGNECNIWEDCCSNYCVDLSSDIHNCGSCGNVCSGERNFCLNSECVACIPTTNLAQICCDGYYYDPLSNKFNCGTCGNICTGETPYCVNGICEEELPVELIFFEALIEKNQIVFYWRTATEINNYGFEIEKAIANQNGIPINWLKIGFVNGNGNSNSPKDYSFIDKHPGVGEKFYRLKQIDFDGAFEYSKVIQIKLQVPGSFIMDQNYPNPFNIETTIRISLPEETDVKLEVYNIFGEKIHTLVDRKMPAGYHDIIFNAENLSSGVYIYRIIAGKLSEEKKMIFLK